MYKSIISLLYINVYDVSQHAKVKSGEWTKDQAFAEFLETFDYKNLDGEVCNKHHNSVEGVRYNVEWDHNSV